MKGRRRTTIFRPGLMSNLIIYYKLINYKCMDNIMKCTPLGEQKSLWLRKTLLIMKFFVLFLLLGTVPCWAGIAYSQNVKMSLELADKTGESKNQIYRYVRLTNLVPELLEFVDEGRIKMRPAVELSYLDEDCQRDVVDEIDLNDATPSHDQTIRMRKLFNEGNLTTEAIHAVMSEEKPNQKEKIVLRGDRVRQLIPKNIPVSQTEDFVCKALEHYNKFLRNRAERDSR